jgi:quercetin dioxygenase-like cupin family protein
MRDGERVQPTSGCITPKLPKSTDRPSIIVPPMSPSRIFDIAKFLQPSEGEPIRSVITESEHAIVVAWDIQPGQTLPAHIHPHGQDTWTILRGQGEYYVDQAGTTQLITAGDVVIAPIGCVHGVYNNGETPLVFISVVAPGDAGYQRVAPEATVAYPASV